MKDLQNFINGFSKDTFMPFLCPFCWKQSLRLDKESWKEHDTSKYHEIDEFIDPEDCIEYIYTTFYTCENSVCKQKIISSGVGKVEVYYSKNEYDGYEKEYYDQYKPKIFIPTLHFFQIPEQTPIGIKELIIASFTLVLQSPSAAVNSLRSCVELLLDLHQVPKPGRINLHNRINDQIQSDSKLFEYKEYLLAMKWLGNTGSHSVVTDNSDIFDVFEIMKFVICGLYEMIKDPIEKARLINEVRGSLSRQQRKSLSEEDN